MSPSPHDNLLSISVFSRNGVSVANPLQVGKSPGGHGFRGLARLSQHNVCTLMCGIAGMFDRSGRTLAAEKDMRQMLAILRHRGPDEFGILLDRETSLGSARLSIIDLNGGTQPIANEDGSLWIVFNGEIFNYLEL